MTIIAVTAYSDLDPNRIEVRVGDETTEIWFHTAPGRSEWTVAAVVDSDHPRFDSLVERVDSGILQGGCVPRGCQVQYSAESFGFPLDPSIDPDETAIVAELFRTHINECASTIRSND